MKIARAIAIAALGVGTVTAAHASTVTVNYNITADNAFALYVSPAVGTIGTLIATNLGGPASQWSGNSTGSFMVTGTEYIQIIGYNYVSSNNLWDSPGSPYGGDNPAAVLASFAVSNGTSIVTDTSNWLASEVSPPNPDMPSAGSNPTSSNPPSPAWVAPTGTPDNYGTNGVGPWTLDSSILSNADWIWAADPSNTYEYADFSTAVVASASGATPLPGTLPLLGSALAALGGLFGWRRRQQAVASPRLA